MRLKAYIALCFFVLDVALAFDAAPLLPMVSGGVSARDYIQAGLILNLDAIENVGYGQHSETAEYWTDLTGNRGNLALHSFSASPWSSDCLFFAGWNGATSEGSHLLLYNSQVGILDVDFTVEVILQFDSTKNYGGVFGGHANGFVGMQWENGFINSSFWYADRAIPKNTLTSVNVGQSFHHFLVCYDAAAKQSYTRMDRGTTYEMIANFGSISTPTRLFYLGTASSPTDSSRPLVGRIKCFRLYSRVLSEAEKAHNARIDGLRFGL